MNLYDLFTRQVEQRPGAARRANGGRAGIVTLSFPDLESAASRAAAMWAASDFRPATRSGVGA